MSARTRVLIVNSPHNPACSCFRAEDLAALAELVRGRDIYLIADEVYEHVVFDGRTHHSVLASPELRERSIAVYSFGKTLHATGLRVGYAVAPAALTAELRKVHQFNTFTIATALQWAIAHYLIERPQVSEGLGSFFQAKRDRFNAALAGSGWVITPAEGSYFQLIDYAAISTAGDLQFADELLAAAGVATIPLSVFYRQPPPMTLLRACIAKRDETLSSGAARLAAYASGRACQVRTAYQAPRAGAGTGP
jgi:methionine aminotransferase